MRGRASWNNARRRAGPGAIRLHGSGFKAEGFNKRYGLHHYRVPGFKQTAAVEQVEARGAKSVQVDLAFFERHNPQELGHFSDEMQAIFQNR